MQPHNSDSTPTSAANVRVQIDTLVKISANLVHLLERETALLLDMKTQDVGELQTQKSELCRLYAAAGYTRKGMKPQANTKKPGFSYAPVAYDERC